MPVHRRYNCSSPHYAEPLLRVCQPWTKLLSQLAALPSHEAARCANEQGKFWADYDKLFAGLTNSNLDLFKGFAKDVRPDVAAFEKCFDSGKYQAAVEKDIEEGKRVGMTGTPAFFVNSRLLSDAQRSTLLRASSTTN